MRNKIKICIIGCGSWAAYYSKILGRFLKQVDLYFCSRDIQKAKLYCRMFKGKGYFGDIINAAEDNSLDAFMIFTPHNVHLENIKALANNHQYILLQKPIAKNLKEAKEIVNLCNQKKLRLMLAENFRFMPAIKIAKKILDSHILGKPIFAYMQEATAYIPRGWRTKVERMGGGILVDLGIHYLSILRYLFDEPRDVLALSAAFRSVEMEGESAISLMARMDNGVSCNLNLAWGLSSQTKIIQIINITCQGGSIDIKFQSRFLNLYTGKKKKRIFLGMGDVFGHKALLEEFIYRTKNGLPLTLNHKTGIDDLSFVGAAYKSLEEGKIINLKEFYLENELPMPE